MVQFFAKHADFGVEFVATGFETLEVRGAGGDGGGEGGDFGEVVFGINEIHKVSKGDLTFVDTPKYYDKVLKSAASFIIINKSISIIGVAITTLMYISINVSAILVYFSLSIL
jgi:hypothetical protein